MNNIGYSGPKGGGVGVSIETLDYVDTLYAVVNDYGVESIIYELDPDTLLTIRSLPTDDPNTFGIGGINNRLYSCEFSLYKNKELDPETGVVINTGTGGSRNQRGIGGMANRLYGGSQYDNTVYELDPDSLAEIATSAAFAAEPRGIGGINNRLYTIIDGGTRGYLKEIDPDTFAIIADLQDFYNLSMFGVGGTSNRLYSSSGLGNLYELDPDTGAIINTLVDGGGLFVYPLDDVFGIGGIKAYTLDPALLTIPDLIDGYTEFKAIFYNSERYEK